MKELKNYSAEPAKSGSHNFVAMKSEMSTNKVGAALFEVQCEVKGCYYHPEEQPSNE